MQATTRTSRFGWRFAMAVGIAAVALGIGSADAADTSQRVPAPTLTDVSAPSPTARLFTVTGKDFTAGGRVYLAIYDQMGAQLYETRWITASPALPVVAGPTGHEAAFINRSGMPALAVVAGPIGHEGSFINRSGRGTLREAFANLCGATAMMRAYDQATATWSNWLTVQPACDGGDDPTRM